MLLNLIQTEFNSKFYSNFHSTSFDPLSVSLIGILWKRKCFLDVLIWLWNFQVTHMAFQYEAKDIVTLRCWGCSESAHLTKAKLHLTASWGRGVSNFDSLVSYLSLLCPLTGGSWHSLALLTSSEKFNFSQLSQLCRSASFCPQSKASTLLATHLCF